MVETCRGTTPGMLAALNPGLSLTTRQAAALTPGMAAALVNTPYNNGVLAVDAEATTPTGSTVPATVAANLENQGLAAEASISTGVYSTTPGDPLVLPLVNYPNATTLVMTGQLNYDVSGLAAMVGPLSVISMIGCTFDHGTEAAPKSLSGLPPLAIFYENGSLTTTSVSFNAGLLSEPSLTQAEVNAVLIAFVNATGNLENEEWYASGATLDLSGQAVISGSANNTATALGLLIFWNVLNINLLLSGVNTPFGTGTVTILPGQSFAPDENISPVTNLAGQFTSAFPYALVSSSAVELTLSDQAAFTAIFDGQLNPSGGVATFGNSWGPGNSTLADGAASVFSFFKAGAAYAGLNTNSITNFTISQTGQADIVLPGVSLGDEPPNDVAALNAALATLVNGGTPVGTFATDGVFIYFGNSLPGVISFSTDDGNGTVTALGLISSGNTTQTFTFTIGD